MKLAVNFKTHIPFLHHFHQLQKIGVKWIDQQVMLCWIALDGNSAGWHFQNRRNHSFCPSSSKFLSGARMGSVFPISGKLTRIEFWDFPVDFQGDQFPGTLSDHRTLDAEQFEEIQGTDAAGINHRCAELIPATRRHSIAQTTSARQCFNEPEITH